MTAIPIVTSQGFTSTLLDIYVDEERTVVVVASAESLH
jgi:hypothetical protein